MQSCLKFLTFWFHNITALTSCNAIDVRVHKPRWQFGIDKNEVTQRVTELSSLSIQSPKPPVMHFQDVIHYSKEAVSWMAFSIQFRVLNIWWDEVKYLPYQFNLSNLCDRPNAFRTQSLVSWNSYWYSLGGFLSIQYQTRQRSCEVGGYINQAVTDWGGWVHKPGCDRLNVFRMPPAPRCSYWHFLGGLLSIRYRHLEGPARWVGSCDRLNAFQMPPAPRCSYWHFRGWLLSIWYWHLEGPVRWLSSLTRLWQTECIPDATNQLLNLL